MRTKTWEPVARTLELGGHEPFHRPHPEVPRPVSDFAASNDRGLDDRLRDALEPGPEAAGHSLDELVRLLTDGCVRLHELERRCLETEHGGGAAASRHRGERGLRREIELLRERLRLLRARVIGAQERP